jgi:DNA-directed RNA polymerase subunit F
MSTTPTEAHRKLAAELCRHATGSNRALHHVPKFAKLIAESEARACDQLRDEVAKLRVENNHNWQFQEISEEALNRAERAEAELREIGAEKNLWKAKCLELIAPHYILDPDLRAQKFRDALAYHPVLSAEMKEGAK